MNAKQAIFDELGDLFGNTLEQNDAMSAQKNNDDDDIVLLTEAEEGMEAVNEDDADADSDATDEIDEESDADGSGNPPDIFESIFSNVAPNEEPGAGTGIDDAELTPEECNACIEAATEAITSTKMEPEQLNWGLDFINRMYDKQIEKIRAMRQNIDWDAVRDEWAQEDADNAAREQEERDRYLQD